MSDEHKSGEEPLSFSIPGHNVQIIDLEVVTDPDEMARLDAADAATVAAADEAAQREQDGAPPSDHKGNGTPPQ
jgi:hypothetical protein